MNKKIASCVFSYSDAQDCIDRHIDLWRKYSFDLFFYSSEDSFPINTYGHKLYKIGKSGHNGEDSIKKHILFLNHMLKLGYDWYLINDYDSINLMNPVDIVDNPAIFGNVFNQSLVDQSRWESPIFIHPPIVIHKTIMSKILELNLSPDKEHGFFDRWLGLCCVKLGINPENFLLQKIGYAMNTIEKEDLRPQIREKKFIHGIKSKEVLEYILGEK